MEVRAQRRRTKERKDSRDNLIASFLLVLLGVFLMAAIVAAGLSQMDHAVCRDASPAVYAADGCQEVK